MDSRTSKQNYYLDIADSVLERSTCLRRKYGAIIVRNDEIISTGYNGAPRGRRNCSDLGVCTRETLNIPSGERYELCRSVHAAANAIISASRRDMIGATIYLVGRDARTNELLSDAMSCSMCKRQIINAGIDKIVIRISPTEYRTIPVSDWIENDDSIFMLSPVPLPPKINLHFFRFEVFDYAPDSLGSGRLCRRRAQGCRRRHCPSEK